MFIVPNDLKINAEIERDLFDRYQAIRITLMKCAKPYMLSDIELLGYFAHEKYDYLERILQPKLFNVPDHINKYFSGLLQIVDPWDDMKFITVLVKDHPSLAMEYNGAILLRLMQIRRNVYAPAAYKRGGFFNGMLNRNEWYFDTVKSAKYIFTDGTYVRKDGKLWSDANTAFYTKGKFYINPDKLPQIIERCKLWQLPNFSSQLNQWQTYAYKLKYAKNREKVLIKNSFRPLTEIVMTGQPLKCPREFTLRHPITSTVKSFDQLWDEFEIYNLES